MELVVATKNKKKLEEIQQLLKGYDFKITSLLDFSRAPRIVENGKTFEANAIKKAVKIAKFSGKLTLGEDSGLEVSALHNAPGVYSSRFSGYPKSDERNNSKLLKSLEGIPWSKRKAQYVCAVAIADSRGLVAVTKGVCKGIIGFELKGNAGFGYDPLFVIPKFKKTFGQLGLKIKHRLSHRFKALSRVKKILEKCLAAENSR